MNAFDCLLGLSEQLLFLKLNITYKYYFLFFQQSFVGSSGLVEKML